MKSHGMCDVSIHINICVCAFIFSQMFSIVCLLFVRLYMVADTKFVGELEGGHCTHKDEGP